MVVTTAGCIIFPLGCLTGGMSLGPAISGSAFKVEC